MLSLCMITNNEEDYIEESLNSVKGLVDEIIVVDGQSTDKTKELAKKQGAKVFDFKWNNDFSAKRNFAIDQAKGDWILVLDADEAIAKRDHERIRKLMQNKDTDGYIPIVRTYTAERRLNDWHASDDYAECKGYSGYFIEQPLRIFRNKKEYRFEGKVHESLIPSIQKAGGKITTCDIPIHHYGGVRKKNKMTEKQKSYIQICEEQILKQPDDIKTRYELALVLIQQDLYDKARSHLEYIQKKQPDYKNTLLFLAETYTREGKIDLAIKTYHACIAYQPLNPAPWTNIGFLYRIQNNIEMAQRYLKKALTLNPNPAVYDQLGEILVLNGEIDKARQLLELAVEKQRHPTHLNNLALIYQLQGRNKDAKKLWKEAQALLEKVSPDILKNDPLLKQTMEKVKKNLEKIQTN